MSTLKIQDIYEKEQDQFGDMNYTEPTEEDLKAIKGFIFQNLTLSSQAGFLIDAKMALSTNPIATERS